MPSASPVDQAVDGGQFGGAALGQPVAGKTRHDPARDDRDQDDDRNKSEPPSEARRARRSLLSPGASADWRSPRTVTGTTIGRLRQFRPAMISRAATATRTTGNDRSAASRQPERDERGNQADQPAEQPQTDQQRQRTTVDRQPPGPVRNGGQQKSGDGRHHEAEQHFVDVPTERIETARQGAAGGQHDNPNGQGGDRPKPGRQEERPEPLGQHGRCARSGHSMDHGAHGARTSCVSNPSAHEAANRADLGSD